MLNVQTFGTARITEQTIEQMALLLDYGFNVQWIAGNTLLCTYNGIELNVNTTLHTISGSFAHDRQQLPQLAQGELMEFFRNTTYQIL